MIPAGYMINIFDLKVYYCTDEPLDIGQRIRFQFQLTHPGIRRKQIDDELDEWVSPDWIFNIRFVQSSRDVKGRISTSCLYFLGCHYVYKFFQVGSGKCRIGYVFESTEKVIRELSLMDPKPKIRGYFSYDIVSMARGLPFKMPVIPRMYRIGFKSDLLSNLKTFQITVNCFGSRINLSNYGVSIYFSQSPNPDPDRTVTGVLVLDITKTTIKHIHYTDRIFKFIPIDTSYKDLIKEQISGRPEIIYLFMTISDGNYHDSEFTSVISFGIGDRTINEIMGRFLVDEYSGTLRLTTD
jgi:hypothetical protein